MALTKDFNSRRGEIFSIDKDGKEDSLGKMEIGGGFLAFNPESLVPEINIEGGYEFNFEVKDFEYSKEFMEFMGIGKEFFPGVRKLRLFFTPSSWMKVKYFLIRMLKRKIL